MKDLHARLRIALGLGAALAALAICAPAAVGAPREASDFINAIGVNLHLGALDGPYGDVNAVASRLSYLGVKHVRDSINNIASAGVVDIAAGVIPDGKFRPLADVGVHADVLIGYDLEDVKPKLEALASYIDAIEGPNEPDFFPRTYGAYSGIAAAVAAQKDLYAFVKGDPALKTKAVLGFAIGHTALTPTVGDISKYADYANIHVYTDHGAQPFLRIPQEIRHTEDMPGRPSIVTETGMPTNDPAGPPGARLATGHSTVDDSVQAKYMLDTILDLYRTGIYRIYLYELFDERSDPMNTDQEAHFGLYRFNGDRKPFALVLHNLLTILADPAPTARSRPSPLNWAVKQSQTSRAMDVTNYNLLLSKRNGAQDLILWAEGLLWTDKALPAPPVSPNRVLVSLGRQYETVAVYDPMVGTSPILKARNVAAIWLNIRDHPLVVEVSGR